ncbi:MAG: PDZ domain-containing protein [Ruminococcus sp.]|nr:PDZ domain-containing protein [Ruminococcus sp.]MBR6393931.1 PDZ domain-containing protein [Ruminococcus sp.]
MDKNKMTGYIAVALASAAVTFGVSWFALDYSRRDVIKLGEEMSVVNECMDMLKENNYPISDEDPVKGAIVGYISAAASDKYTKYTPANSDEEDMTAYVNTSGTALASGFQIEKADDGNILLTEITPGLAADKQGLCAGDKIVEINGESVTAKGYENIANKMLGKQDTKVSFTVLRDNKEIKIEFVRDHKYNSSCLYESIGDVEYIRLRHFEELTKGQYDEALKEAENKSKVLIDLRNNTGGKTEVGVYLAAQSCGECEVVKHAYTGKDEIVSMKQEPKLEGKKVVLLVNNNTASSAEIFTAALKQHIEVTIVGENTRGKGVYQIVNLLDNGDQFKYTAGTYTVGDWECYQGVGIAPDVEVHMDRELIGTDDDIQLKKALELLD